MVAAVVAVLVAAYVVWRWRRLSFERKALGIVAVLGLAIYASGVLSALPDPKQIIEDVAAALGPWTYALVGVAAFLETGAFVGLVAPGETIVISGGVVAGQGEIELLPLIGIVWACAVLGDTTSFYVGRRLGRSFLEKHGPRVKITHERLEQVDGYFDRHGGKTILIVVGCGAWSTLFCVLGYIFWRSFDKVQHLVGQALFGFAVTVGVIAGVVTAYRRRDEIRAWLDAHREHPLVKPLFVVGAPLYRWIVQPLVRVLRPPAQFVGDRLMPGELGLELTTLVAVGGVGAFFFIAYLMHFDQSFAPTPLDNDLLDLADRLQNDMLVDIAKVVSGLAALPTVIALVAGTSVLLVARRRYPEAIVLVLGLALTYIAVQVTTDSIARPSPTESLVNTAGEAYPSGHAAYATAWVAAAVVLTRRLRLVTSGVLVFVALGIAAAVGVTRVYLREHWWSDVAGGWGLGAALFALLGAIALVVEHIRHNGAR
jgi:undecaprenyl-diphosphatase